MPDQNVPSILIVDDDFDYCRLTEQYLNKEGCRTFVAHHGDAMRKYISGVSLVLLDLHLPKERGLDLAQEIREKYPAIGIIIVTASDDEIDRIVGLEIGADDYVCKPFNNRELMARIRSVLRRIDFNPGSGGSGYQFEGLKFDMDSHRLMKGDEEITLTGHEYNLLVLLVEYPGKIYTRAEISRRVSNRDWFPDDRSIDVLASKLRRKLEDACGHNCIRSKRGVGYQFAAKVQPL